MNGMRLAEEVYSVKNRVYVKNTRTEVSGSTIIIVNKNIY